MSKRGGFGGGMPGNMGNLMKQAQKMQRQMEEASKELEEKEFTASSGGGAVNVTVSGKKEIVSLKISEEAVDPDDVEGMAHGISLSLKGNKDREERIGRSQDYIRRFENSNVAAQVLDVYEKLL